MCTTLAGARCARNRALVRRFPIASAFIATLAGPVDASVGNGSHCHARSQLISVRTRPAEPRTQRVPLSCAESRGSRPRVSTGRNLRVCCRAGHREATALAYKCA